MINRIIYLVCFLLFSYFITKNFIDEHKIRESFLNGYKVDVEIIELPTCNAKSTVMVKYENKNYKMVIGKNECIQSGYKITDKLPAIYYDKLDMIVRNKENLIGYYFSIVIFIVPLFCLYQLIKK